MDDPDQDPDTQDQAEVFDETHVDDDGTGETDFEEMERVLDVTRHRDDSPSRQDEEPEDYGDDRPVFDAIEAQADELLGIQHPSTDTSQDGDLNGVPGAVASSSDEIELVYTGLLRNQRGAQASAAHWEAKRLSDEDLSQLGYGPNNEEIP